MTRPGRTGRTRGRLAAWVVAFVLAVVPALLGTPAAAAAPAASAVDVQLTSVVLTGGQVVVTGTVTNNSSAPVYSVRADLWRSRQPLTTREEITESLTSDDLPDGAAPRLDTAMSTRLTPAGGALAPQASSTFTLRGTLAELGLGRDASYWVGANVSAAPAVSGKRSLVGRDRSLVTVPGSTQPRVATVVVLSARPTQIKPNLFADDSLAQDLSGRLTTLVAAAGGAGVSYVIDPSLYDAAVDMADGYRVVDGTGTRAGSGQQAAQQWLAGFRELTAESGYRGLYAQPDIAGGAALGTTSVLARAQAATEASPLKLSTLAVLDRVDAAALRIVGNAGIPVLTTAVGGGRPWSLTETADVVGAVTPGPQVTAPQVRNVALTRAAATSALSRAAGTEVRLVRTAEDASIDQRSSPGWLNRVTLDQIIAQRPTERALGPTPASLPAVTSGLLARASRLSSAMDAYGSAAPRSGVANAIDDTLCRISSESWSGARAYQENYLDAIEARVGPPAISDGIRLSATPLVTMASAESTFPVTVTNGLTDTITVRVAAQSANAQRIEVGDSREVTVRPGDSETAQLPVEASGNGVVDARVHVEALDGRRLTPDVTITVEATSLGAVGWVITVVSGVVLVASTAWRIRQVRRSRGTTAR